MIFVNIWRMELYIFAIGNYIQDVYSLNEGNDVTFWTGSYSAQSPGKENEYVHVGRMRRWNSA